jgi:hypothetical protein
MLFPQKNGRGFQEGTLPKSFLHWLKTSAGHKFFISVTRYIRPNSFIHGLLLEPMF